MKVSALPPATAGSSPLTRGKRGELLPRGGGGGLIPAHAGKTRSRRAGRDYRPAHPRSRGENVGQLVPVLSGQGSSPLTRGKRVLTHPPRGRTGLIPAHAGKTTVMHKLVGLSWAHPRSRGENIKAAVSVVVEWGSSPLTRGKPPPTASKISPMGLIPAHAGKTCVVPPVVGETRAHPRSRGENNVPTAALMAGPGSSPLTRGKPVRASRCLARLGLIPAHAGKTPRANTPRPASWAHPRSRGENTS